MPKKVKKPEPPIERQVLQVALVRIFEDLQREDLSLDDRLKLYRAIGYLRSPRELGRPPKPKEEPKQAPHPEDKWLTQLLEEDGEAPPSPAP